MCNNDWLKWIKEKYNICITEEFSYVELLEAVCTYVYRFDTGKEQCIQAGYLYEEEILEIADLLVLEVLFGKNRFNQEDESRIGFEEFTDDYLEYLDNIGKIQLHGKTTESEELLEWIGDGNAMFSSPNSYNQKNSIKFFTKKRAKDFYIHLIRTNEISPASEIFYFHMFSVYLLTEEVVKGTSIEPIKAGISKYRKMMDDNLEFINILKWHINAASGIGNIGRFKMSYKGIFDFLDNFRFKRDFLELLWLAYINTEFSEMEGGLPTPIYSDFREIFNRWLMSQNVNIMCEQRKDGMASLSSSNAVSLIRKNFGKKYKRLIGKEHFTFNVPEKFLGSVEATLQYDRAQSYNYFWTGIYSLISEVEKNMVSMAELHCVIIYIIRRLEEFEKPNEIEWKNFMYEIGDVIKQANITIAHTADMVNKIISTFEEIIKGRNIQKVLLSAVLEKMNNLDIPME